MGGSVRVQYDSSGETVEYVYEPADTIKHMLDRFIDEKLVKPSAGGYRTFVYPSMKEVGPTAKIGSLGLDSDSYISIGEPITINIPAPPASQEQITPCILIVDCSGSMAQDDKIGSLNRAIATFATFLSEDDATRRRVRIQVIRCGGTSAKILEWTDGADFRAIELTAGGGTPLDESLDLALAEAEEIKRALRAADITYTRPIIIVMTDGEPNDKRTWQASASRAQTAMLEKRVHIWPVAILPMIDSATTQEGADLVNLRLVKAIDSPIFAIDRPAHFGEFYNFLFRALKALSNSRPGESLGVSLKPDKPAAGEFRFIA